MPPPEDPETPVYDVIIVGAGPCGLAVAARLRERTPSAVFTDQEHQRYHWIRRHAAQTSIKAWKTGRVRAAGRVPCADRSMLVLDAIADRWMARWDGLFGALGIEQLRSPSFFHVDPSDRDALLAFAHEHGRMDEMVEIRGVVGKELSKHRKKKSAVRQPREPLINERDRKDYFTPSTALFAGHCKSVAERYGLLGDTVRKETVEDIVYDDFAEVPGVHKSFLVKTNKRHYFARTVVLAVGPGSAPAVPGHVVDKVIAGACHAMHAHNLPDPVVKARILANKPTNVLVVGGGLSSAQVSELAIRRGVSKVWHIMRGPLKGARAHGISRDLD
ncbi:MAG: SidA/IucD/PvdA family monooxygenase [Terriglobus roseus]|nr:SidA/IucD/PvdA family monooxygenase [Terriglobus roseus]